MIPLMPFVPLESATKKQGMLYGKMTREAYFDRVKKGTARSDIFSHLVRPDESHRALTQDELLADTSLLIVAGAHTTSCTLSVLFSFLCRDPAIYNALKTEVDGLWDGKALLESSSLGPSRAPILNGAINEALRLKPPSPLGMPRLTPPEGVQLDEYYIPGGNQVSTHCWSIQQDQRNFTHADQFIPQRWSDELRPTGFIHNSKAFIPFSVGQYSCVGKTLAYQEMRLFVTALIRQFDFSGSLDFDPAIYDAGYKPMLAAIVPSLPLIVNSRAV